MLRVAANRDPPLSLRLREGGPLFSGWGSLITGGLVNDTTPVQCVGGRGLAAACRTCNQ